MDSNFQTSNNYIGVINTGKSVNPTLPNQHQDQPNQDESQGNNAIGALSNDHDGQNFKCTTRRKVIIGATILIALLLIIGLTIGIIMSKKIRAGSMKKSQQIIFLDGKAKITVYVVDQFGAKAIRVETVPNNTRFLQSNNDTSKDQIIRDHIIMEQEGIVVTLAQDNKVQVLVDEEKFLKYIQNQIISARLLTQGQQINSDDLEKNLLSQAVQYLQNSLAQELNGTVSEPFTQLELNTYTTNQTSNQLQLQEQSDSDSNVKGRLLAKFAKKIKNSGKKCVRKIVKKVVKVVKVVNKTRKTVKTLPNQVISNIAAPTRPKTQSQEPQQVVQVVEEVQVQQEGLQSSIDDSPPDDNIIASEGPESVPHPINEDSPSSQNKQTDVADIQQQKQLKGNSDQNFTNNDPSIEGSESVPHPQQSSLSSSQSSSQQDQTLSSGQTNRTENPSQKKNDTGNSTGNSTTPSNSKRRRFNPKDSNSTRNNSNPRRRPQGKPRPYNSRQFVIECKPKPTNNEDKLEYICRRKGPRGRRNRRRNRNKNNKLSSSGGNDENEYEGSYLQAIIDLQQ